MNIADLFTLLQKNFPYEPNGGQIDLLRKLAGFLLGENSDQVFILKGYAGTGKTTIVRSLVNSLPLINGKLSLLAPTGRAAKVLSNYTRLPAYTIHKKIYVRKPTVDGSFAFQLKQNLHSNTLFVVDEASMIASSGGLDSSSVLDDLMSYVFNGTNCKLLLIGDTAQLPPVGLEVSPALDLEFLKASYYFQITQFELTDVIRQNKDSGILYNATQLRQNIKQQGARPHFELSQFDDVIRINGDELEDAINDAYSRFDVENTMIICRSNKRANIFNQQIRARIRWQENELSAGDYMMVVKNNYHWLPEASKAGFIANGDIIQIMQVGKLQEMHGFRFADVRMKMVDYLDEPEVETRLLLNTIMSESPALSQQENRTLFDAVMADYGDISNKRERIKKVKEDKFFNALQVKFAYAITCHKAQGGQWPCVFVEQGYLTDQMINTEYLRWLYTALTRASEKLYLVNFNENFFT